MKPNFIIIITLHLLNVTHHGRTCIMNLVPITFRTLRQQNSSRSLDISYPGIAATLVFNPRSGGQSPLIYIKWGGVTQICLPNPNSARKLPNGSTVHLITFPRLHRRISSQEVQRPYQPSSQSFVLCPARQPAHAQTSLSLPRVVQPCFNVY